MAQVITGIEALNSLLRDLPAAFSEKALTQALKEAAEPIAQAAKQNVRKREGDLADSITITAGKKGGVNDASVFTGFRTGGGAAGWRAHFEEFGTSKQAAHPFLRPAYDEHLNEVKGLIAEKLAAILKRRVKTGLRNGTL